MTMRLSECPPNEKLITHDMQLGYLNWDEVYKARAMGYYDRTQRLGRVRVHDRTPERKIDRTNKTRDIACRGTVVLSDIPSSLMFRNGENDKLYVDNLVFRGTSDDSFIYTGCICISDVPPEDIKTEQYTGRRYVDTVFRRLYNLDTYMNTHQLIIAKDDGSEIEIGRFREFMKNGASAPIEEMRHNTTISQRPSEINGIKF